jgi:uncharacterized DUF497 family protein
MSRGECGVHLYTVTYDWDPRKAAANARKHGIRFADAVLVLEDLRAVTVQDDAHGEERWVTIGMDAVGRILVVVYFLARRRLTHHLGSGRDAGRTQAVYGEHMKDEYDFSKGKRGAVVPVPAGKTRVTIRLDSDVLDWFREEIEKAGGGNYQSLINLALRDFVNRSKEPLEKTLRRVIREELREAV